jgi:hypothetical protein
MSVIFQKAYSYLLIQDGNDWYLTYFTGGPVDIDICVKLTEEEIKAVSTDQKATEELMARFKANRSLIKDRRIIPSVIG